MIINQRTKTQRTALSRMITCVGCLLLMVFIGRVALVSVYGYAGVPKFNVSSVSGSAEEQDDDKKDESKYTEKQFKCIAQNSFVFLVPIYSFLNKPFLDLNSGFVIWHPLAVPTPPPNC